METMWAALPEPASETVRLGRVPRPRPATDEAVVAVMAAGMNRADLLHARGRYAQRLRSPDRPDVAGMELAGRVVEVGDAVDGDLLGSRVMAMIPGAYAEFAAVPADLLLPVPEQLDWVDAAALPMGLLTEHEAIVRLAHATSEDRILITAATSGVGLIGLQVAIERGLRPVVTTRDQANDATLRELGAAAVAHDPAELRQVLSEGVDVVIDHVGGEMLEAAQQLLRDHARVVSVGRLGRRSAEIDLAAFAGHRARLIGTTWRCQSRCDVAATVAAVNDQLIDAVGAGRIRPLVGAVEPLSDITAAYDRLSRRRPPGKVVVACHAETADQGLSWPALAG